MATKVTSDEVVNQKESGSMANLSMKLEIVMVFLVASIDDVGRKGVQEAPLVLSLEGGGSPP